MGSGLILLVIVGAWLAVLVPMALRSHDASRSLGTAERFQDAMRVLSRRDGVPGPPQARVVRRGAAPAAPEPAPRTATRRVDPAASRATLVARRRRVLVGLGAFAVITLVAALTGPVWLLVAHLVADLLLVAYAGHLRQQQVLRAQRAWRSALDERAPTRRGPAAPGLDLDDELPAARAVAVRPATRAAAAASVRIAAPAHIAGVPDRMPPRPAPREAPVRGAQGEPWAPVPVPLPGYVTAPTAPRRVLDLTRPGEWADGVAAAERDLGIDGPGPGPGQVLERQRAAGDW